MDWRDIPSLPSLRAFEAAARRGSLSAAARELNVTHAAIAQHVRTLERRFGRPLLVRQGRSMALTDEGAVLALGLGEGFGAIAAAIRDLDDRNRQRALRVALTPSFAAGWLMPRIGGFWAQHPDILVELVPSPDLVDLRRDGFDMAVRYGKGPWPGVETEALLNARHVVVASPRLVGDRKVTDLRDLQDMHWLLERGRQEERVWAEANGLDLSRARLTEFDVLGLVIEAVRAGHGVSILPTAIVERDMLSGDLVGLLEEGESVHAYHMLTRPDTISPERDAFIAWLRSVARQ